MAEQQQLQNILVIAGVGLGAYFLIDYLTKKKKEKEEEPTPTDEVSAEILNFKFPKEAPWFTNVRFEIELKNTGVPHDINVSINSVFEGKTIPTPWIKIYNLPQNKVITLTLPIFLFDFKPGLHNIVCNLWSEGTGGEKWHDLIDQEGIKRGEAYFEGTGKLSGKLAEATGTLNVTGELR